MSEDNDNKSRRGELEDMMSAIGGPLQKAMINLGTKIAKKELFELWNNFKRLLATASDPFFRKDMGERYFNAGSVTNGILLWMLGAIISTALSLLYPPAFRVLLILGTWITGITMVVFHFRFGRESILKMAQYRNEGLAYHTRSRGTLRWGDKTGFVYIGMIVVLLIFNPCTAIFFIASATISSKLAAEQDAAIYSRYLDALDAQVEKEFLENAILGKCPTEITQLSRPLPATMTRELRENIAAAAVGKPVKIVAKGQNRAASVQSPFPPPNESSKPIPFEAEPTPATPEMPAAPSQTDVSNQPDSPKDLRPGKATYLIIIAFLAVSATAFAVIHFWPSKPANTPAQVAVRTVNVQPVQPQAIPTPSPPADQPAPVVQTQAPEPPPAQAETPVVTPAPPPVDTAALALAALKKQREEEQQQAAQKRQQTIDQFYKTLSDKAAELAQLQTDAQARLDANTNKIAKVSWIRRSSLRHENEKHRVAIMKALQTQQKSLNLIGDSVRVYASDTNDDPSQVTGDFQIYDQTEADISGKIKTILDAMDDAIAGNTGNSGLIQIK